MCGIQLSSHELDGERAHHKARQCEHKGLTSAEKL